jgi:hypothetical protein
MTFLKDSWPVGVAKVIIQLLEGCMPPKHPRRPILATLSTHSMESGVNDYAEKNVFDVWANSFRSVMASLYAIFTLVLTSNTTSMEI